jgi:hypothetical protein
MTGVAIADVIAAVLNNNGLLLAPLSPSIWATEPIYFVQ